MAGKCVIGFVLILMLLVSGCVLTETSYKDSAMDEVYQKASPQILMENRIFDTNDLLQRLNN